MGMSDRNSRSNFAKGDRTLSRSITPHDKFTWAKFIEPDLGTKVVSELSTGELEQWLADQVRVTDDKEKLRASRATANRRWSVLRAILNAGYHGIRTRVTALRELNQPSKNICGRLSNR